MHSELLDESTCALIEGATGRRIDRAKSRLSSRSAQISFSEGGFISVLPSDPTPSSKTVEELEPLEETRAQRWRIQTLRNARTVSQDPRKTAMDVAVEVAVVGTSLATGWIPCIIARVATAMLESQTV